MAEKIGNFSIGSHHSSYGTAHDMWDVRWTHPDMTSAIEEYAKLQLLPLV